jgi:hypothetical protein
VEATQRVTRRRGVSTAVTAVEEAGDVEMGDEVVQETQENAAPEPALWRTRTGRIWKPSRRALGN